MKSPESMSMILVP